MMNKTTQPTGPGELLTPAEREAAEAFIFQRLAQIGAPAEVIASTRAHLDFLEVAEAAHRRLRLADAGLFEAWDDLNPLDPLTPRAAIESWISAAKDQPAAAYHLGFVQAVILLHIELQTITGREEIDKTPA